MNSSATTDECPLNWSNPLPEPGVTFISETFLFFLHAGPCGETHRKVTRAIAFAIEQPADVDVNENSYPPHGAGLANGPVLFANARLGASGSADFAGVLSRCIRWKVFPSETRRPDIFGIGVILRRLAPVEHAVIAHHTNAADPRAVLQ
jgi:hypothetical protein